jgi:mono/diheme cytochrome c family protein
MAVSFHRKSLLPGVAGAALAFFATAAPAQDLAPITFTSAQANAGAQVYSGLCASCHGAQLQGAGGPRLTGEGLTLYTRTVGAVYSFISQNMPRDDPGGLTPVQYVNVLAFLARSNGFTAGPTALPADPEVLTGMGFRQ